MATTITRYDEDWVIDDIDWKGDSKKTMMDAGDDDAEETLLETIQEEECCDGSEDERVADGILGTPFSLKPVVAGARAPRLRRTAKYVIGGRLFFRLPWWWLGRWILFHWGPQLLPSQISMCIGMLGVMYYLTVIYRVVK